ncbi:hypothetical protein ABEB36_006192 [Hypothenemus hampei]|uniref:FERM domain-containing protein 8 n=1 Tax=Hypothenemus hampei TaxID=57062 RepID=A0ABD1EPP9_HYPHA
MGKSRRKKSVRTPVSFCTQFSSILIIQINNMDNQHGGNIKDSQQIIIQASNYNVTVIPVEFPMRNRLYNNCTEAAPQYSYCQESVKNYAVLQQQQQQSHWTNNDNSLQSGNDCKKFTADDIVDNQLNQRQGLKGYGEKKDFGTQNFSSAPQDGFSTNVIYEEINDNRSRAVKAPGSLNCQNGSLPDNNHQSDTPLPPFQGVVIPMCVYLHNKTVIMMEIEDTPSANCDLICQAIVNCDELGLNKNLAIQVFTLWMISPILELQLKPHSRPYEIRKNWRQLIDKYGHASSNRKDKDEPKLVFQRSIFFPKETEEKIKDQKILELLYEECKYNILNGRYPSEISHLIMLGGIQAREELGPYNSEVHTTNFFREEQSKFLPVHVRKSPTWTWLPISSKNSAEVRLLEQFKRIPATATNRKLIKKYLEYCWGLPFYGAAFFEGQIEEPVRGLISLLTHQDVPVLVAINSKGIYIIDDLNCQVILGLRYEEFNWECSRRTTTITTTTTATATRDQNPDSMPCLFIQFNVVENGARVSKMLQVFSKQASLMDVLIQSYATVARNASTNSGPYPPSVGAPVKTYNEDHTQQNVPNENDNHQNHLVAATNGNTAYAPAYGALTNKLSKLTLATFDEEGRCIGRMGSWSFSY